MAKEKKQLDAEKQLDLVNVCVDKEKLERAQRAVSGGAKSQSAESVLLARFKGEFEGDNLVLEIYKGLAGLVNPAKAVQNRKNEAKAAKAKQER